MAPGRDDNNTLEKQVTALQEPPLNVSTYKHSSVICQKEEKGGHLTSLMFSGSFKILVKQADLQHAENIVQQTLHPEDLKERFFLVFYCCNGLSFLCDKYIQTV